MHQILKSINYDIESNTSKIFSLEVAQELRKKIL